MVSWSVSSDHEEGEQREADPDVDLNALRVEVLDRDPDDVDPFGITKPERGMGGALLFAGRNRNLEGKESPLAVPVNGNAVWWPRVKEVNRIAEETWVVPATIHGDPGARRRAIRH